MKTVRSQGENSVELTYEYGDSYWAYSNNKNFFNDKGLVVRNEYTRSDNEVNVTVFEYDEKGNLVRSTETIPGNDSPTVYTYTYDDKGNLTYRDRGGDQTTFTYDESGKRIKANMTVEDGNSYETVYTYNDKGELIKMTETKTKNGASETHSETVFTYDDKGRVTSSTMTMPDGYTSKDAWTYDEYGNVIKVEETWGNPGSLTTSVIENTDYQIFYSESLHPVLNEVLASLQPEIDLG
jgi:YD repeat-containing protein